MATSLSTGLQITYISTFTTMLGDMVYPFSFVSSQNVNLLGFFFLIAGIVGGSMASYLLFKLIPRKGKRLLLHFSHFINFVSFFSFGLIMLSIQMRSLGLLYFSLLLNGFTSIAIYSVGYEFSAVEAEPIDAGLSLGCVNIIC